MTALTGTLIGDAIQKGQVDLFVEMGVLRPDEVVGPSVGTGVFGGYLYMNASAMRLFGVRMPGMSASDADEQVMGSATDMPPYRRAKGDRSVRASLRLTRYLLKMMRSPDLEPLARARVDARAWLTTLPDLNDASDEQLLEWLETYPPRIGASMKRLLFFSGLAAAPRGLLDRALDRPGMPVGLANRIVGGTGDIDSAQLAQRVWALSRLVTGDETVSAAFDDGLDEIAIRTQDSPLKAGLDGFLADHGHRGNDEYELATPAWAMDPSPVYALIDRLRRTPADRDPVAIARRLAADADEPSRKRSSCCRATGAGWHSVALASPDRDRSGVNGRKTFSSWRTWGRGWCCMSSSDVPARRGGPTDVRTAFCVTASELPAFVADPDQFADTITERAEQHRYLDERIPPEWFDGNIPDPTTWPQRGEAEPDAPAAGSMLSGIAVSGGHASGPARVIHDPNDPRGLEPGEVLVCAITDPSWTPLFLTAAAVVCDTGAVQSHAAIVARELASPPYSAFPQSPPSATGRCSKSTVMPARSKSADAVAAIELRSQPDEPV